MEYGSFILYVISCSYGIASIIGACCIVKGLQTTINRLQ